MFKGGKGVDKGSYQQRPHCSRQGSVLRRTLGLCWAGHLGGSEQVSPGWLARGCIPGSGGAAGRLGPETPVADVGHSAEANRFGLFLSRLALLSDALLA